MASLNKKVPAIHTHEGAKAQHINAELQLRRSVLSCLLWEREFYEDGETIADRIKSLIPQVNASKVASLAIDARSDFKLRHVPLLIVREMARYDTHRQLVSDTLAEIIQRPDELTEFLAIYWKDGKCPLSGQIKKGLGRAFKKFNAYSLAKYNRDGAIKLKDVLFLSHPKPDNPDQDETWKQLIAGTLPVPDTWEVALSGGSDKKQAFERLMQENKLGALALLRNLRNMQGANVDNAIISAGLEKMDVSRVLPFRFIAAAKHAPSLEPDIEKSFLRCTDKLKKLSGRTFVLVDVSGSMDALVSRKSDLMRIDAACALAAIVREIGSEVRIFSFSEKTVEVPLRRGFALIDAIKTSQRHWSTYLGSAVNALNGVGYDRIIVITDEQSHDTVPNPSGKHNYMINVASNKNGIGYSQWIHIDGFSEAILNYIFEVENIGVALNPVNQPQDQ